MHELKHQTHLVNYQTHLDVDRCSKNYYIKQRKFHRRLMQQIFPFCELKCQFSYNFPTKTNSKKKNSHSLFRSFISLSIAKKVAYRKAA